MKLCAVQLANDPWPRVWETIFSLVKSLNIMLAALEFMCSYDYRLCGRTYMSIFYT